jgi:hypothetical protein
VVAQSSSMQVSHILDRRDTDIGFSGWSWI